LGSLTWKIWSTDPSTTDGIGDVGTISSPYAYDVAVTLSNGDGTGVRNVGGPSLLPSGDTSRTWWSFTISTLQGT